MKRQCLNTFPEIGLAGLSAKKILPVVKRKEADKNQNNELAGLSLNSSEQTSTPQALNKPLLHHPCLPRVCNSWYRSKKWAETNRRKGLVRQKMRKVKICYLCLFCSRDQSFFQTLL
ncbi:hypothetical protein Fot_07194 [Forsythia ovata]|uniref:Uncharacterized protein n=1 Tax=Forsythia ovata TaxID=205694 RepID=A0ABD1WV40_9LAMI